MTDEGQVAERWGTRGARFRRRAARLWEESDRLRIVLAVVIGLVTGLWAIGFSWLIDLVRTVYYEHGGEVLRARGLYLWLLPLLPMSGALVVGLITHFLAPEAEGHGVPEVMDAMARRGGRIRPRVAAAKAVASALTIGSGGSAGTEGPIIQIGAAIGSGLGQWLRLGVGDLRVLIGCGAAAGIASIFHAPIAGVLFAVEVLLRDVSLRSFLPIILSSVASSTVTHAVRGERGPLFPVPREFFTARSVYTFSLAETLNYAVLGAVCGLVALAFVKLLYLSEDLFRRLPVHRILRPVAGAALLGLVVLASGFLTGGRVPAAAGSAGAAAQPPVMGNGYPVVGASLQPGAYEQRDAGAPGWTVSALLVLLVAKIAATALTLGSGGSGGVFAPSLFIGATSGGAFGLLLRATGWFPGLSPGAYALVGMAAVVAASIHAPLTAALMLFELTGNYEVIIPILLAGVTGLAVARRLESASIYTLKLLRRGVDLHRGQDISLLKHVPVREVMRRDPVTLAPEAGLTDVIARFVAHPGASLFVVDERGRLRGVIADSDIRAMMPDASTHASLVIAADMMRERGYPCVAPDDSLADVLRRMGRYRGELPVVEHGRLAGAIWPEDVIERYNAELFKRDMAASMAASMAATLSQQAPAAPVPALENTSIAEVPVPPAFIGRSLGSLEVRQRYQATILLVKQAAGGGVVNAVPSANYIFRPGDVLLVMGPDEQLRRLARS